MAKSKQTKLVRSNEDAGYSQKKNVYDTLANIWEELKREMGPSGWNLPVDQLKSITLKLVGEDNIQLSYASYEMSSPEIIRKKHGEASDLLDEVVKQLKKKFKEKTKKTLNMKKLSEMDGTEKYSQMHAETSWASLGAGPRQVNSLVGKYVIKCSKVYEYSCEL